MSHKQYGCQQTDIYNKIISILILISSLSVSLDIQFWSQGYTLYDKGGNGDLNSETLFLIPSTFRTRTVPAASCSSAGWHFLHMKTLMLRLTAEN